MSFNLKSKDDFSIICQKKYPYNVCNEKNYFTREKEENRLFNSMDENMGYLPIILSGSKTY